MLLLLAMIFSSRPRSAAVLLMVTLPTHCYAAALQSRPGAQLLFPGHNYFLCFENILNLWLAR